MGLLKNNISYSENELLFIDRFVRLPELFERPKIIRKIIELECFYIENDIYDIVEIFEKLVYLNKNADLAVKFFSIMSHEESIGSKAIIAALESVLFDKDSRIESACQFYENNKNSLLYKNMLKMPQKVLAAARYYHVLFDDEDSNLIFYHLHPDCNRDNGNFLRSPYDDRQIVSSGELCRSVRPLSQDKYYSLELYDMHEINTTRYMALYQLMRNGYRIDDVIDKHYDELTNLLHYHVTDLLVMIDSDFDRKKIDQYYELFMMNVNVDKQFFIDVIFEIRQTLEY